MTRLISGEAGGRSLVVPPGGATRPTSDRVREALFSRLQHRGWLDGTRVLDLYAGSGALGLEAASRGASHVLLVEHAAAAVAACRRNAASTGLDVEVRAAGVGSVLAADAPAPFDVVLADPPYDLSEAALTEVLVRLVEGGWLAEDALVVVERSRRSPEPSWPAGPGGLVHDDLKTYGETVLWFARRPPADVEAVLGA